MASKSKRFVDDGWAVWVEGDDLSTVYINDWINPKNKSFVDFAIKIRGVKKSNNLYIYVPFLIEKSEIFDLTHFLKDENIFRGTFNNAGILDYMKNQYTSEAAYNGKILDIVHFPIDELEVSKLSSGTLIKFDLSKMHSYIDNDDAYIFIRVPHKSMDLILKPKRDVSTIMTRIRDLIMSPVISESYVYQIRINEARMLPPEINKIGAFHRQRLKKAVVSMAISEDYEVNDYNCYRIRRIEEELYTQMVPEGFNLDDVINYLWQEDRESNYQGRFNFYLYISRNKIDKGSMFVYMVLLIIIGLCGDFLFEGIIALLNLLK